MGCCSSSRKKAYFVKRAVRNITIDSTFCCTNEGYSKDPIHHDLHIDNKILHYQDSHRVVVNEYVTHKYENKPCSMTKATKTIYENGEYNHYKTVKIPVTRTNSITQRYDRQTVCLNKPYDVIGNVIRISPGRLHCPSNLAGLCLWQDGNNVYHSDFIVSTPEQLADLNAEITKTVGWGETKKLINKLPVTFIRTPFHNCPYPRVCKPHCPNVKITINYKWFGQKVIQCFIKDGTERYG